jgi:DNA-binding NtrC family response regulator
MADETPAAATTASRVLVADDQRDVLRALKMLLSDAGYAVDTASSPADVAKRLAEAQYDLLLMDLNYARDTTSGAEGIELIRRAKKLDESLPVVVMTAYGNVDIAVRVMREGAIDFIEKPWDNQRLLNVVGSQLDLSRLKRRARALEASIEDLRDGGDHTIVAESASMKEVLSLVERVGPSDATVLIAGENGVGKGVVAAALHRASARSGHALLTADMGTLSGGLVEAELFGHERGAFTDARSERMGRFELADHGTLFLDEIANCPPEQQSKLLRVIESGEFERLGSSRTRSTDVRVLCATNADLRAEVKAGRFREDLFYRVNTVEIHIPPLRKRLEDLVPLALHFLAKLSVKYRRDLDGFSDDAVSAMKRYPWFGNVRELAHAVERAVLLARGSRVVPGDLRLEAPVARSGGDVLETMTLDDAESELIARALERHSGSVRDAADSLGLSRSAMYRRLERHGLGTDESGETR